MSLTGKLFGFRGRLRRRDWWLLSIGLMIAQFPLAEAAGYLLYGPEATVALGGAVSNRPRLLVSIACSFVLLWPNLALAVKRRHDREHSGKFAAAVYVTMTILQAMFLIGGQAGFESFATSVRLPASLALSGYLWLSGLSVLWLVVFLGFLEGTPGANRYGPSPREAGDEVAQAI